MTLSLGRVPGHRYLCPCWECWLWRDAERRRRDTDRQAKRAAANAARSRYKARQKERLAAGLLEHGARAAYDAGCRCGPCRAWHAAAAVEQRHRRIEVGLADDDARHGTEHGYKEWGCREACCRDVHAAAELVRWRRRASRHDPADN